MRNLGLQSSGRSEGRDQPAPSIGRILGRSHAAGTGAAVARQPAGSCHTLAQAAAMTRTLPEAAATPQVLAATGPVAVGRTHAARRHASTRSQGSAAAGQTGGAVDCASRALVHRQRVQRQQQDEVHHAQAEEGAEDGVLHRQAIKSAARGAGTGERRASLGGRRAAAPSYLVLHVCEGGDELRGYGGVELEVADEEAQQQHGQAARHPPQRRHRCL